MCFKYKLSKMETETQKYIDILMRVNNYEEFLKGS